MAQQSFQVQEIHCGACEAAIRKSLSRLDGVRVIEPDAATNRVDVIYDETQTDATAIAERLTTAGYPVVTKPRPTSPTTSSTRPEAAP